MTIQTVAENPSFGSVDYFVAMIRRLSSADPYVSTVGIVEGLTKGDFLSDAEILRRVRNAIAALDVLTAKPMPADPTGLLYTRADSDEDDPTPVSPARGLHVGAVTDGGLVPVDEAPGDCTCWATSPNGCPQHAVSVAR